MCQAAGRRSTRWRPVSARFGALPGDVRPPAVAGSFYPAEPDRLRALVTDLLEAAEPTLPGEPPHGGHRQQDRPTLGLLVPHAGLMYSGIVAAAGWRRLARDEPDAVRAAADTTVVLLGTNHGAGWLDGIGIWDTGAWRTPLGDVPVDTELAGAVADLGPPFAVDPLSHLGEHSIEVQLPLLALVADGARIVPLAVSAGTGREAIDAGGRLGRLLAARRDVDRRIVVAISSDMAHYPGARDCTAATADLLPPIVDLEPEDLARREHVLARRRVPGLVCGMCGVQPAVLGLAALRAFGAVRGVALAAATSADAGGPADRTVGYLAVEFVGV